VEPWETELVERVGALAREEFAPRAARYDREGSFPHENIEALRALGIPGMALPRELGGLGIGLEAHVRIVEAIAYGDGSTAVALNMHLLIADFLRFLPPFPRRDAVLRDVAESGALICGPGSIPVGELDNRRSGFTFREVEGGFRIDGRSGFASGSDAARYVFVPGVVPREGVRPDFALALPTVDTPGVTIVPNWDAMGLRGTASNDVVLDDVFVPREEAVVIPAPVIEALAKGEGGIGLTPDRVRGALGILAIWLGLAQAALDFAVEYVKQRHGYLAGPGIGVGPAPGYRAEEAWAQVDLGHLDHWVETGRTVLYDAVRRLGAPPASQHEFTRMMVRTVYHLRRMGEEVASGAMRVCGAHAYTKNRPLERIVRDLVGGNVMAWKTTQLLQTLGRGVLGMPITITGPAGA
jgi:alkylation response protein AidB-like acyl-CoA dehydrogenase